MLRRPLFHLHRDAGEFPDKVGGALHSGFILFTMSRSRAGLTADILRCTSQSRMSGRRCGRSWSW